MNRPRSDAAYPKADARPLSAGAPLKRSGASLSVAANPVPHGQTRQTIAAENYEHHGLHGYEHDLQIVEEEEWDEGPITSAQSAPVVPAEEGGGDLTDGLGSLIDVTGATGDNPLLRLKERSLEDIKGSHSPASTAVYNVATENGPRRGSNDSSNPNGKNSGSSLGSSAGSQKSNGSSHSSGIQVTKNEMGAISFKLPGRITHKTTIKLAHYPQPGTEIINIENPPDLCMPPPAPEIPILEDDGSGAEEVCLLPPEEDPNCCSQPPPGNFANNCNFCTYNVGQQQGSPAAANGNGALGCPSPHAPMQHSLRVQQQMRHQQMQQQRQQYQQMSQYYSAFNANNIFRRYYPGAQSHAYQNNSSGQGYGYGAGPYGYQQQQHAAYRGHGHGQGHGSYSNHGGHC